MVFRGKSPKCGRTTRNPRGWMRFMDQNITSIAGVDRCLRGICVSRENYGAIGRNESIPIALHRVLRWESAYGHINVLVDKSGADLVDVNVVSFRTVTLISIGVGASFDIDAIRLLEMIGHGFQALGTVYLERLATAICPWSEDQVRVPKRVVRMQVGYERHPQSSWFERGDATRIGSAGTTNNSGTEVN